jgi:diaminohydroxyphosphoribosylaminopyrimidine deaminase/5-amino-6-(5-phosphoribosylamino)uracil reductase
MSNRSAPASAEDFRFLARAIELAERGLFTTDPNPRVGCVLVTDGVIAGEGWHEYTGGPHAEIRALEMAGDKARGATCYLSLEPCCHHGRTPPCTEALIAAGVSRVVCAGLDPNPKVAGEGIAQLREAGVNADVGVLQAAAAKLNPGFFKRMTLGLPYVRLKLAMSLDGRTAMASGESQWITGADARRDVQRWRARSSVILTGIETILADDPSLNVRDPDFGEAPRQPLRVVLDSQMRTPASARVLQKPGSCLVMCVTADPLNAQVLKYAGAELRAVPSTNGKVNLEAALKTLAQREINEVLVEAGPTLSGALLEAGLVDELVIYLAPQLLGDSARGLVSLPALSRLADAIVLDVQDIRAIGTDWRIIAAVKQNSSK